MKYDLFPISTFSYNSTSPPLALAGIVACAWVTIRSKAGHFLYLNLGICLLLVPLGAIMRFVCLRNFATVIFEMNP